MKVAPFSEGKMGKKQPGVHLQLGQRNKELLIATKAFKKGVMLR